MSNIKTSKTPYEIRLELLQLATSILLAKHQATAEAKAETTQGCPEQGVFVTTAPTTEDIIIEANKLNEFISNGTSRN